MIHPGGIERRCPALDPVHLISLFQQKFSQISTVLARHAGYHRTFHTTVPHRGTNPEYRIQLDMLLEVCDGPYQPFIQTSLGFPIQMFFGQFDVGFALQRIVFRQDFEIYFGL